MRVGTPYVSQRSMAILCGTDFSNAAEHALIVAAHFAARTHAQLHLMHCIQFGPELLEGELESEHVEWVAARLHRQAERARAAGADVRVHMKRGSPDDALIELATDIEAKLIVIGPLGGRSPGTYRVGSHAERLVQRSHVPVLIVRDPDHFNAWLGKQERPLRIVLGADLSRSTQAALALVQEWRRLAPCDVSAVHLYWPPQQFARLGLDGVRSYLDPDPDVTKTLTRELMHRLAPPDAPDSIHVYVEPHLGRLGDRLADIAYQREADLLVVGTHARGAFGRMWEGSVSRWALHAARTSVLCVPAPGATTEVEVPRMRSVLVATDFTPAGNAAIGVGYALTEPHGTVHVVSVVPLAHPERLSPHDIFALEQAPKSEPRTEEIHRKLGALLPGDSRDRSVRLYALESNDPAAAITQAALRLDADAICLGRRGHSSLAHALLGSVSKEVLQKAERPVVLAQAPRE
jgi:nucleotide-binding universal stress UspA family protein